MTFKRLALTFGVAAIFPAAAQAAEIVLKVAHFLTPTTPAHTRFIVPWCEKIAAESQGRLSCQIYPANQLGGTPSQLLNQVRDGVADIAWTLPGYTPGRFPLTEVFELPFFSTTYEATSRALWDFTEQHAKREFAGLVPIATWTAGPYALHFRDRQVLSLDDIKGLKVRAPSRLGNKLLSALGATPVGMPAPQMAEGLSKGVIDGALLPWEAVPPTKTHELTKFHAEASGQYALSTATTIFVMNKAKYDSLPADLRRVIDNNRGRDVSGLAGAELDAAGKLAHDQVVARGNTVYAIPAAEVERWRAASSGVAEEWIKEVSAKGVDGRALHAAAAAFVRQHSN
ncbi:TRAP transporter substrate-binding protein [Parazoarcus communis]|uniref:C4-dicarboxylate ABC transporter n=1 Tax=Parazoarcus communis SWub3 = DSM 12120 TaxID=1121029 RepID=A0A323USA4_9RHOO|nr:TRAP transporter substrate-binding protein [Parazoarcus communis]NMG72325.1 C4-dicarboxylate ABC transporter [Parazoarcus communis SWub3 = DSM 12120]PZA14893.1 C4-dicarboxylate ABC transporter [Azoarcus communis] [Parazoarcus communis SWub3 = DSM 12120]